MNTRTHRPTARSATLVIAPAALTVVLGAALGSTLGSTALGAPGTPTRTPAGVAAGAASRAPAPPLLPLPPPRHFVATVDNPYAPFVPGTRWVYRSDGPRHEREHVVVRVLHRTREIAGIEATVVRDTVRVDGELVEDTSDWFAQDRRGRVWYLGEATAEYEHGEVVSTEGSWETGVDGARAGVVMVPHPRVGVPYRQEYYAGHAEDQAELLTADTQVATASETFTDVRMTQDTTPLEPSVAELKLYARGVGVVVEIDLSPEAGRTELVHYRPAP